MASNSTKVSTGPSSKSLIEGDKVIASSAYSANAGALAIRGQEHNGFYTCRESFHGVAVTWVGSNKSKRLEILYGCPSSKADLSMKFLEILLLSAGVAKENWYTLHKTTNPSVLCASLPTWWQHPVRLSLFTALVRCSLNFGDNTGKEFEKALYSTSYTVNTRLAVDRVMSGHLSVRNKQTTGFTGWVNFFSHKTKANIENVLVKVKRKKVDDGKTKTNA